MTLANCGRSGVQPCRPDALSRLTRPLALGRPVGRLRACPPARERFRTRWATSDFDVPVAEPLSRGPGGRGHDSRISCRSSSGELVSLGEHEHRRCSAPPAALCITAVVSHRADGGVTQPMASQRLHCAGLWAESLRRRLRTRTGRPRKGSVWSGAVRLTIHPGSTPVVDATRIRPSHERREAAAAHCRRSRRARMRGWASPPEGWRNSTQSSAAVHPPCCFTSP